MRRSVVSAQSVFVRLILATTLTACSYGVKQIEEDTSASLEDHDQTTRDGLRRIEDGIDGISNSIDEIRSKKIKLVCRQPAINTASLSGTLELHCEEAKEVPGLR